MEVAQLCEMGDVQLSEMGLVRLCRGEGIQFCEVGERLVRDGGCTVV